MISEIYFDLMVKRPTFLQSKTKRLLELREENKRHHFLPYKIKFSKILRHKNKTTSELLQQNHMVRFFNETLVITNQTILSYDTIDKRTKWDPVLQKKNTTTPEFGEQQDHNFKFWQPKQIDVDRALNFKVLQSLLLY